MGDLQALMNPRSVVIVGDSVDRSWGSRAHAGMVRFGFGGRVFPVNPKYIQIRGERCYAALSEIRQPADCVVIAIPAASAVASLREAAERGVRAAVIFASGFAEANEVGRERQAEMAAIAERYGMAICGPNSFGIINVRSGATLYGGPLRDRLIPGTIGIVSQSGDFCTALIEPATERGIGFSFVISAGNQVNTELADYIEYLVDDPDTKVIAAFVEGIRDPERFQRAANRALAAGKPIVVLKVVRSPRAQRATLAHTGTPAGSEEAADELFRQTGVTRVESLNDLLETAILFSKARPVSGRGIGVITGSGGGCALFSDAAESAGLPLADFTPETCQELSRTLPEFGVPQNPLDATGVMFSDFGIFERCLEVIAEDPNVDLIASYQAASRQDEKNSSMRVMAKMTADAARKSAKMFVPFTGTSSGDLDPTIFQTLNEAGVPLLMGTAETWRAIRAVLDYQRFRKERPAG